MPSDELETLKNSLIEKQILLKENNKKQVELRKEADEIYAQMFELRDKIASLQRAQREVD